LTRAPTISSVFGNRQQRPTRVETRHVATGSFGLVTDAREGRDRIELTLPTPPSSNNMFCNSPNGGRFKSAKYTQWLDESGWLLTSQKPGRIAGKFVIEVEIRRPTHPKVDLDNRIKGILDLLTKHRVIGDDSMAEKITLSWSDTGQGARVILTKAEGVAP